MANGIDTDPLESGIPVKPPPIEGSENLDNEQLLAHYRWAAYQATVTAAGATIPREMQEAADAALKLAQGIVILDPSVVAPGGVPPDALSPPRPRIPMDPGAPSAKHNAGG